MGPPGVPKVPILGPNRGMFSKLNWPGPLGSGGHSHTIFSNGRFQGAQRSFGGDVQCTLHTGSGDRQSFSTCVDFSGRKISHNLSNLSIISQWYVLRNASY